MGFDNQQLPFLFTFYNFFALVGSIMLLNRCAVHYLGVVGDLDGLGLHRFSALASFIMYLVQFPWSFYCNFRHSFKSRRYIAA